MSYPFRTIALIGKYRSPEVRPLLLELAQFISGRGLDVWLHGGTAKTTRITGYTTASLVQIGEQADLAIVVGGDGTLLNVARDLAPYDIPLAGINQGRLGFLTDIPPESMLRALAEILDGEYHLEPRTLLAATVLRDGEAVYSARALNDVVVNMGNTGQLIEYEIYIDRLFVDRQRGDGLVVATPTGSTAYALSAGGPILTPSLAAIVLAPICPHTLTNRPIVAGNQSLVCVRLNQAHGARVHFDGQNTFDLRRGDTVQIQQSDTQAQLLHPKDHSFFDTLRKKLHWGGGYAPDTGPE
jgi:NAD+ kinase